MPGGRVRLALAKWLRLPALRRRALQRDQGAQAVPVPPLPSPGIADGRHHLPFHLPLTVWFQAIYLITRSKKGISSLELARRLGVTQTTAWKVQHKLAQVMLEREADKPVGGPDKRVEMDDAYLGGARRGGKRGRGASGKTPIVVAVETTTEGRPHRLKLRAVKGFRKTEIEKLSRRLLAPGTTVVSDGLGCFTAVTRSGCHHDPVVTGSGALAVQIVAFKWVNTTIGNIKNSIRGTYHAIRPKHVPRYLAQFEYRFNCRYRLEDMVPRLRNSGA